MGLAIAALIPAFNCERTVAAVVRGCRRYVEDVVVVDDGSQDGTGAAARQAGARVVVHPANQGKGAAVRTGLALLLGEAWTHILMLDADGQHDPEDIPQFVALAEECDLVVGNRLHQPEAIPPRRYWTNFIGTRALELMTGFPLEDSQCGFRLVATSLLRRMELVGKRYSIDTEILVRAGRLGARFAHVPVRVIYNGAQSHFRPLADTVHIVFSAVPFKVDERLLRHDPGPESFRRKVPAPPVLPPAGVP